MSPSEIAWRVEERLRQEAWSRRSFGPAPTRTAGVGAAVMPVVDRCVVAEHARLSVVAAADRILEGHWEVFGVVRDDLVDPDWAFDPTSGRSYPAGVRAFRIDYRSPGDDRNVKQVWELSRHHHLTVLASAWWLTGDDRYATRAAEHLRSWWRANPVGTGVHWNSGIELGIRLVSWVWMRRLLHGWPGAADLFEGNPVARHQVYWHQRWLAEFRSRGSSANNHVVAEAAGQLVASCAFDWFDDSDRWRAGATALLREELVRNTFPSGLNREQAFEYHGLVTELGLVAAAEAEAAGVGLGADVWRVLCRSLDALAAVLDVAGRPPRYGDGDDGRALVVDDPAASRWASLLATGAAVCGPTSWWPPTAPDVQSAWLGALARGQSGARPGGAQVGIPPAGVQLAGAGPEGAQRPAERMSHFADAGLTLLRTPAAGDEGSGGDEEIWCRCDGGPHGFLSIAAHGHADALSVEVRVGGVEILADPGTYSYHNEPAFRAYFRSTLGHNTLELGGVDQSVPGGPFMWVRRAETRVLETDLGGSGPARWSACHDGYERLTVPATHRRTVTLDAAAGEIEVVDQLEGAGEHEARLAFHLGPAVTAELEDDRAALRWRGRDETWREAVLLLPPALSWSAYRGSTDPVLGWYSTGFGRRQPTTTLLGAGTLGAGRPGAGRLGSGLLRTRLCLQHASRDGSRMPAASTRR